MNPSDTNPDRVMSLEPLTLWEVVWRVLGASWQEIEAEKVRRQKERESSE